MKLDFKAGLAILSAGVLIGIGLDRRVLRPQQQVTGEPLVVVALSDPNPATIESPINVDARSVSAESGEIRISLQPICDQSRSVVAPGEWERRR